MRDLARADLHVHSKFSNQPSEWVLKTLAAPESYTEPLELYRQCKERGMAFVTISDHDCIEGALSIAHLPDVFLSEEVTVSFPEDGCVIHCLVSGITEAQHREIQRRRHDVYAFRDYLYDEDIVHSVAHPLYRVNDRLGLDHLEKLLVLFKRFEARNGIHDRHLNELCEQIFGNLDAEILADLAERHRLDPRDPEPWVKHLTGGSDDHGGFYIATTWTETPEATTVEEYLAHLRAGRHAPGGETGSSLRLAQSLFAISYRYFQDKFLGGHFARTDPFARLLRDLGRRPSRWSPKRLVSFLPWVDRPTATANKTVDEHTLERANRLCAERIETFATKASKKLRRGRIAEAVGQVSHLAPLLFAAAPYAVAFRTQWKDQALLEEVCDAFPDTGAVAGSERKAWVTDTLTDVNGVAKTVRTLGALAERRGRDLVTLACGDLDPDDLADAGRVQVFEPLSRFALPAYESLELSVPPLLEVMDFLERGRFGELVLSTPGPLGLTALAAGKLLGLPLTGVYHTDFPEYVARLTDNRFLEGCTRSFMAWFYGQMDRIYVPSVAYGEQLVADGLAAERIALMPRGVDRELFRPGRRDRGFWRRFDSTGGDDVATILYVGRLSKEKNLDLLLDSVEAVRAAGRPVRLALVGDGPYRRELQARARRHPDVVFTGFLHGEELATAYASADLFAFPSTTDTFGNVILEACASGLPSVVTDQGGPQEIVERFGAGRVVPARRDRFAAALHELLEAPGRREQLGLLARRTAEATSWETLLDRLWRDRPDVHPWEQPADAEPLAPRATVAA